MKTQQIQWERNTFKKQFFLKLILAEFKINRSDPNRSCLLLCCGVSTTNLYTRYLLSFAKLSYWSLPHPRQWQCWTSASGRSIPASRLVLLSSYPDQQELKFLKYEEMQQEYLMQMMLAPPFGHWDELKLKMKQSINDTAGYSDTGDITEMYVYVYLCKFYFK